jgi:hypothetical protein
MIWKSFNRIVSLFLVICSGLLGLLIALLAIGTFFTVSGVYTPINLMYIRASGVVLLPVSAIHMLPMSLLTNRQQLQLFAVVTVVLSMAFGLFFYLAFLDDPFRSNFVLANRPFSVAVVFCVFPLLRAGVRMYGLADQK